MPYRAVAVTVLLLAGCSSGSDPAAERAVSLSVSDALRFEPSTVTAAAGEKVRFTITNTGAVNHEFAIGDASFHTQHAAAATASPSHDHGGHQGGMAVAVPAGKTATVTFTMPAQPPSFACYLDSHDKAGMKGTITYS